MFTDRHALALGASRALVNGQIQHISTVSGPSFLGWEHPPVPITGSRTGQARPTGADQTGQGTDREPVAEIRRPPAHQKERADGRPNPRGTRRLT